MFYCCQQGNKIHAVLRIEPSGVNVAPNSEFCDYEKVGD